MEALYESRNGIFMPFGCIFKKFNRFFWSQKHNFKMLKFCFDITSMDSPHSRDSNAGIFKQFHSVMVELYSLQNYVKNLFVFVSKIKNEETCCNLSVHVLFIEPKQWRACGERQLQSCAEICCIVISCVAPHCISIQRPKQGITWCNEFANFRPADWRPTVLKQGNARFLPYTRTIQI